MQIGPGLIILLGANVLIISAISFAAISAYKNNRKLKRSHELLRSQVELQELSFDNIYNEIHDNIGQALSLAKLNLHTVQPGLPEAADEKIRHSTELVGKAIIDLREMGKGLNTQLLRKMGLSEVIQRELTVVAKAGSCQTAFRQEGSPVRFSSQKELIIFRVFQGALNYSINHSKAKTVIVRLEYRPQGFILKVCDDGLGFDLSALKSKQNLYPGIREMQNRVSLIGAHLKLSSTPRKGTTVSIDLPLEKKMDYDKRADQRCTGG